VRSSQVRRAYLLVGYPRTGSSVFCQALAATGVLGVPQEYFARQHEGRHAEEMGLAPPTDQDYQSYLQSVLSFGSTLNGVFGAKMFWAHAQDLVRRTGLVGEFSHLEPARRLWAPFGDDLRLVFTRRDCLRAVLSLWRAERTGVWGRRPGETDTIAPDSVDLWAISVAHADMHAADIGWQNFLATTSLPVLRLSYETMSSDLASAVRQVAEFVGVEPDAETLERPPYFRRQAGEVTGRHLAQWWRLTGGCDLCRPPEALEQRP
jgi:trehalose 2-sulfotransferase